MSTCTPEPGADSARMGPKSAPKIRPSKVGKWRALALILVHVAIVAHVLQWQATGRTLSPVEPSEAMQFTTEGVINAGFIFFAVAILSTLLLGRWFCGWACHLVALQDLCRWMLVKIGIRPRLVNMGILRAVPWLAFTYMFLMPLVGRWLEGQEFAATKVDLYTAEFWRTFPSLSVAIASIVVTGFAIVYFLGAKGFCNYGCPYGAIFGITDQLAPVRIRVTDACEGCGHCTAVCTSNVRVHEEVRDWKMVVDPSCMKCLDCVSVCPKDALYVGVGSPAVVARPRAALKQIARSAWAYWALVAAFTVGTFWALMTFNGAVGALVNPADWPLIGTLSAGSLVVMFAFRGKARPKQDYSLGEEALLGGSFLVGLLAFRGLHGSVPMLFALGVAALFAWALVQALRLVARADVSMQNLRLKVGGSWRAAGVVFAGAMVLVLSGFVLASREQMSLARTGRVEFARILLEHGVGAARSGNVEASLRGFRRALQFDPASIEARENLAGMLCQTGRFEEGLAEFEVALRARPDPDTHVLAARALLALHRPEPALEHASAAVELAPERPELRGFRADVLEALGRSDEAAAERAHGVRRLDQRKP